MRVDFNKARQAVNLLCETPAQAANLTDTLAYTKPRVSKGK